MKTAVKILSILVVLSMMAFSLASCSTKKYDVICLEDENGEIVQGFNENMLSFHMSMEKTDFLVNSLGSTADIPEFWTVTVGEYAQIIGDEAVPGMEDKTFADIQNEAAMRTAKDMIAASYMYEQLKGQDNVTGRLLADSDKKLEAQIDNQVSQIQLAIGSKEDFNSFISGLGITMEDFRKYCEMSYKATELRKAVDVSEDDKKEYFGESYAIVKHILVNTNSKTNEAGEKVSLTAEEKEAKLSEVKTIEARIASGEEFEAIFTEYEGADPGNAIYTEGYFVTDNGKFMPEFQDAALTMAEGEIKTVYTSYGAHVMKKYPMDKEKYNIYSDTSSEIETVLRNKAYSDLIKPYSEKVKTKDEVIAKYSMATVPMMTPAAAG